MHPAVPSVRSVLEALTQPRLVEIGRKLGVHVRASIRREEQLAQLSAEISDLRGPLAHFKRKELKEACRLHGLPDSGKEIEEILARLLLATAPGNLAVTIPAPAAPPRANRTVAPTSPAPAAGPILDHPPRPGDLTLVRQRQYLVEEVLPPPIPGDHTLVRLVCLDDDAQGRPLEVLWELELGARMIEPRAHGLGTPEHLDEPRQFAAYLHALRWSCVTATDAKLFQAPFRAGIKLLGHQLTPLKKALELPRVNLFIADDVGLGKTIEAGLVLQELLLRQRVEFTLVVCPASVVLQWRDEMEKRFGLRFELYNRTFVARRRQDRGFQVNPWQTHNRFVVSYQTLRRPEYREPLLAHLDKRLKKSLLILDEAHTAAPASATKYAVDSRVTGAIRNLAPRFENRLFLSATPHNGHSNSFSSLLEILDPQRFTRGVPVRSPKKLEPVMVRRLKSDLRALGEEFPERRVVQVELTHDGTGWSERRAGAEDDHGPEKLADGAPVELLLATQLAEYTRLVSPGKGRSALVFQNLQKRLLSSVEAFHRTLALHAENVGSTEPAPGPPQLDLDEDDVDDETLDEHDAAIVATGSRGLSPTARSRQLLDGMVELASANRTTPDAKLLSLVAWIRKHQCPGANLDGHAPKGAAKHWSDRRVLIFTEYGDTKRLLTELLRAAIEGTDEADERILTLHGGMGDEGREEVQRAFNSLPGDHPVRILVATDAAREGINLQGHCADLFHYDVPWNPARMEQRNGRIDRTLQPEKEVRCHYFFYPQRPEDAVLRKLVQKVDRIQRELGSLGAVVMDRLEGALAKGLAAGAAALLDSDEDAPGSDTVRAELDTQRDVIASLKAEIDEAGKILDASRVVMEFKPAHLRDALEVGCALSGGGPFRAVEATDGERPVQAFAVPELPDSWQGTLDTLRPARRRDEPFWDWRKRPPQPVVFEPPDRMNGGLVHLHLSHPFVQRVLSRFTAQGFSAHDLSRVTVVRSPTDHVARVIAFGRLSLFGPGAIRLHDELVSVAAQWLESQGAGHLRPFAVEADRRAIETLEDAFAASPDLEAVPERTRARLVSSSQGDFGALWPAIEAEAATRASAAREKLHARGGVEAAALRGVLTEQRAAIQAMLAGVQLPIEFAEGEADQRDQFEQDRKHMAARLGAIDRELTTEPATIERSYDVVLTRLVPVGLVYLWPASR